jgi:hypothetical protein
MFNYYLDKDRIFKGASELGWLSSSINVQMILNFLPKYMNMTLKTD